MCIRDRYNYDHTNLSMDYSINKYLSDGLPKDKLIVSLPYFGSVWETADTLVLADKIDFKGFFRYASLKKKYLSKAAHPDFKNVKFDSLSVTNYINYSKDGKYYQVWYDDANTLGIKYDYIKKKKLAGVSIWRLGYDSGYTDLSKVLKEKFSDDATGEADEVSAKDKDMLTWSKILNNIGVLKKLLAIVSIIFLLGFLFSLRDKQVRQIIFKRPILKNAILFTIPLLIFILLYVSFVDKIWSIVILAGILLGYGLYYLLVRTEQVFDNANRIP